MLRHAKATPLQSEWLYGFKAEHLGTITEDGIAGEGRRAEKDKTGAVGCHAIQHFQIPARAGEACNCNQVRTRHRPFMRYMR